MDAIDWRMILVDNYKKLGLNENELSIILVTNSLIQKGMDFITPDIIALKMTLDFHEIDNCFTNLIKKDILTLEWVEKLHISIEPLKKKLIEIFYEEVKKASVGDGFSLSKDNTDEVKNTLNVKDKKVLPEDVKEENNITSQAKLKTPAVKKTGRRIPDNIVRNSRIMAR